MDVAKELVEPHTRRRGTVEMNNDFKGIQANEDSLDHREKRLESGAYQQFTLKILTDRHTWVNFEEIPTFMGSPILSPRSRKEKIQRDINESYDKMFSTGKSKNRPEFDGKSNDEVFNSYDSGEVYRTQMALNAEMRISQQPVRPIIEALGNSLVELGSRKTISSQDPDEDTGDYEIVDSDGDEEESLGAKIKQSQN
jgi:hypothetical protein